MLQHGILEADTKDKTVYSVTVTYMCKQICSHRLRMLLDGCSATTQLICRVFCHFLAVVSYI